MKALVIPDIHLKPWIFDRAESILQKGLCDKTVFLGDFVDDWDQQNNIGLYNETFDRLLKYVKDHESLICWGNHDMSYLWHKLETGFSYMAELTVRERVKEVEKFMNGNYFSDKLTADRAAYMHRIDNVLFSHGGLMASFVYDHKEAIAEMANKKEKDLSIDDIVKYINRLGGTYMWEDNSPLWARPNYAKFDGIFKVTPPVGPPMLQVVGHTPVPKVTAYDGYVLCDTFSTYEGKPIGSQELIIIDTKTTVFEAVK